MHRGIVYGLTKPWRDYQGERLPWNLLAFSREVILDWIT